MVRGVVWFRCAAMHDPVRPVQRTPARLGWEAKLRRVDLEIERSFQGEELLRRMKGWITVDPEEVIRLISARGRLRVLDDRDLVVECRNPGDLETLKVELNRAFGDQVDLDVTKGPV